MLFGRPRQTPEVVERLKDVKEYDGVVVDGYKLYRGHAMLKGAYVELIEELSKSRDYKFDVVKDLGTQQIVEVEVREGYVTALVVESGRSYFAVVTAE